MPGEHREPIQLIGLIWAHKHFSSKHGSTPGPLYVRCGCWLGIFVGVLSIEKSHLACS